VEDENYQVLVSLLRDGICFSLSICGFEKLKLESSCEMMKTGEIVSVFGVVAWPRVCRTRAAGKKIAFAIINVLFLFLFFVIEDIHAWKSVSLVLALLLVCCS
jgi:hypothetical protein